MKSFLPLLSLLVIFASCTTAYKSGQTPDDVYFSPSRPQEEYVRVEKEDDRQYRRNERQEDYYSYNDDRYLRMKIRNRNQWSYLDEYYRDPYAYNYNGIYYYNPNCYCTPRTYWNSYYNPYGSNVFVVNHRYPVKNSTPRKYNLHVFDDPKDNNYNSKMPGTNTRSYGTNRTSTPARINSGNVLRSVFGSSDNSSYNNSSAPKPSSTTTQSSSNNSNNSSSNNNSSGSSTAPRRKF